MKIIENGYLPLPGFKAMNLFGLVLFVRKGARMNPIDMNHEEIHSTQWKELYYIGFILWYVIEWLVRLSKSNAYRNISFEREAYANQENLDYLKTRKRFAFIHYLLYKE